MSLAPKQCIQTVQDFAIMSQLWQDHLVVKITPLLSDFFLSIYHSCLNYAKVVLAKSGNMAWVLTSVQLQKELAPLQVAQNAAHRIEGEYIVLFRPDTTRPQLLALVEAMKLAFAATTDGSEVKNVHVIGDSFRAISAKLSPAYYGAEAANSPCCFRY
ncbi:uncharacterized protein ACA1_349460 [Acanthamoeba castellanii str. Neff]|uniref:Uncharacterized protein n=1 Tax=Acanthamoeba castellanii (strain ATCC 30010 / Neff) TaxID=1257118 RepID=L8GJC0_ACACF|nr:uncharacterized protein ACA1_349460 [Acanthamoeba castellanii str. Neff]ELR13145.1 hypothetical protein ACA1_349460 [Acanthamoeba castellanii str. Neff]